MSKTVKDHIDEADQIVRHVKDSDELVKKLRTELDAARRALEWLGDFTPKGSLKKSTQFKALGDYRDNNATAGEVIEYRVKAINSILGDRA